MNRFLPQSMEIHALLHREHELERENDLLWRYFKLSVDFFAAAELHDLPAAREAHDSLQELAAQLMEREDDLWD